jgi:hypothetical protein
MAVTRDTKAQLQAAENRLRDAQAAVERLRERQKWEDAFKVSHTVYILCRYSIDHGNFQKIEGVFSDMDTASEFATGLAGYGLGKDLFIDPYPLFTKE